MDKIEIIEYDEDDDSEEEDEEESEEEEEFEEEEIDDEKYEEHKSNIKQKTDRELIENISIRLLSLENDVKHIREDLVDIYNLIIESEGEEEED